MNFQVSQMVDTVTGLPVTDLSSVNKLVTHWFRVGLGTKLGITPVWAATGSPAGTIGIEFTNDPSAGVDHAGMAVRQRIPGDLANHVWTESLALTGDAYPISGLVPAPVQPAGTAGRMPMAFESPGEYIRFSYMRTSGGTASVLTFNLSTDKD
jgi:hypothetical protein